MRKLVLALAAVLLSTAPALAQPADGPWANKLFANKTSHDFGNVARGAQLKHSFTIKNPWSVPVEITNVRVSCGCVSWNHAKKVLQPLEESTFDINMDARRFTGPKSVAVYVTLGPQFISTAVINVSANARTDVAITPGDVNFGVVNQGQQPTQSVEIEYTGNLDWQVKEVVKPADAPLDVKMEQIFRKPPTGNQAGRVVYRMTVKLESSAPGGVLKHDLLLKTNDPSSPSLVVSVDANVQAALRIVPAQVSLSTIKLSEAKTFKVQIMGNRPFRITDIKTDGKDKDITLEGNLPAQANTVHTLTLRVLPLTAGELKRSLTFITDLDKGASVSVSVEANVAQGP